MIHVRDFAIFQSALFQPFNALAINCVRTHENGTELVLSSAMRFLSFYLLLLLSLLSIFCLKTLK